MINKIKCLTLSVLLFFSLVAVSGLGSAVVLAQWELISDPGAPSNIVAHTNAGNFAGGAGISAVTFSTSGAYATQWPLGALDSTKYFQIALNPETGYNSVINKLNFGIRRSLIGGPQDYKVQWSKNSDFSSPTTIATENLPDDLEKDGSISGLNIPVNSGEVIYIRWFGYTAADSAGTLRINDNTLSVEGTVTEIATHPSLKITKKVDMTLKQNGTIELENNGNVQLNDILLDSSGDFTVAFSQNNFALIPGQKLTVTVSPVDLKTVGFGGKSVSITATAESGTQASINMSIKGSFCNFGETGGNLEITSIGINKAGDDDTWNLLDTVEIEVKVENVGNDKIKEVIVELGLFDSNDKNQVSDLNFENTDEEVIKIGSINDGSRGTATFSFKVPADFEDGNYKLAIKAYSDDLGESKECTDMSDDFGVDDRYTDISVDRESDSGKFIAFDNIEFTPQDATCGDSVTMTLDVYNVGDEDQEDQVKVNLENTELGISESFEIRADLNQGDKETINFDFVVPQDATDKTYSLRLSSDYDYRSGSYKKSSDEDIPVQFAVKGCGTTTEGQAALINAQLESDEVLAGEDLIVRATITNLKSNRASFGITAADFQSWATLKSVSPQIVDLEAGASTDVILTFSVNEDASGDESFTIEARDSSGKVDTKEVVVQNIEGVSQPSTGLSNILGGNIYLWIIGAVNVILIILIIIVAVRVARR